MTMAGTVDVHMVRVKYPQSAVRILRYRAISQQVEVISQQVETLVIIWNILEAFPFSYMSHPYDSLWLTFLV